jgi:hypothetical protein
LDLVATTVAFDLPLAQPWYTINTTIAGIIMSQSLALTQ